MKTAQFKKLVLVSAVSAMLAACGGGGGGSTPAGIPAVTPAPTPVVCVAPQVNQNGVCVSPAATFNAALKPADLTMGCVTTPQTTYLPPRIDAAVSKEYGYLNQTWGSETLTGFRNCMAVGFSSANSVVAHWTWDYGVNNTANGGYVKAYPFVSYGEQWGFQDETPAFPKQLSTLTSMRVEFDADLTHSKSPNYVPNNQYAVGDGGDLLIDTYFSSDAFPRNTKSSTIKIELSINLTQWGSMTIKGTNTEQVVIDGVSYTYYIQLPPVVGNTGKQAVFNPNTYVTKGSINLVSFINFLKARGELIDSDWIDFTQIGTEISEGTGETKLNKFAVTVN